MVRIKIEDLDLAAQLSSGEPSIKRVRLRNDVPPDVTLINLNLMLVNQNGRYDQQNYVPLGILYIASFLAKHGYNVEMIDYQLFSHARSFDIRLFVETIGKTAALVGISTMSNLLPLSILCAEEIKKRQPSCKIVLGGTGPSPLAKEIIRSFPFIDSVVTGEGELPMLDFLRDGVTSCPPRKIARNLDNLPFPAYSLIDFNNYDAAPSIIASRGCPYKCMFCTEPHNFGGNVRLRSIRSIIEELNLVHSLSDRTLFLFQDDILPLNKRRFAELLKAFRSLSFPFLWKCFSRVDLMTEELMQEMVESGCVQVRFGIESGSNQTLERIQKGFTINQAYATVEKSLKYFSSVHVSFIWGYPFETSAQFKQTLKYVSEFERMGATVLLFEFSPLPGSELYRRFPGGLTFSPEHYSFFTITGHETIKKETYEVGSYHHKIYTLIKSYPDIFPGFYTYEHMNYPQKRKLFDQYRSTRRTPIRSQYDL